MTTEQLLPAFFMAKPLSSAKDFMAFYSSLVRFEYWDKVPIICRYLLKASRLECEECLDAKFGNRFNFLKKLAF